MLQENVTFYINSDDDARLYIDDSLIGGRLTKLTVSLAAGYHKIVVTYVEWTGLARVQLQVAPNATAVSGLINRVVTTFCQCQLASCRMSC